MTKPQKILSAANRVLADQTNQEAVTEVAEFIQPVFDVAELEELLFSLESVSTLTGAVNWEFLHGPVPRGFEWIYEEINVTKLVGAATSVNSAIRFVNDTGTHHIVIGRAASLTGPDEVNFVRMDGAPASPNPFASHRPIVAYPGQFLFLRGTTAGAIGDSFRVLINYRQVGSTVNRFRNNDNAENVVVVTA